ncbi:MAG: hypothetical protein JSV51_01175 [Candidatus Bathyarchaeota archaeon]|nr:MAG: hypothetical protein JSV51_01175 [Candidatus Bathyarchaeota archaeon]
MAQMSDEEFKAEQKKFTRYHNILEWPLIIFFFIGIIAAVLNVTIGGFTPVLWFVLSFWFVLVIICMEVSMIRANLERKRGS